MKNYSKLLEILTCPICKSDLQIRENFLRCTFSAHKFPMTDGIMLMDEGKLDERRIGKIWDLLAEQNHV